MSPRLKISGFLLLFILLGALGFGLVLNINLAPDETLELSTLIPSVEISKDAIRFGMTQTREANILSASVDELTAVAGTPCATATQAQPVHNLLLIDYIETHLAENQIAYKSVSALIYRGSPCILVIPEREMRQEVTIVLQASDSGVDRLMIFETVIDSLATGWEIDMTFLRRVTIQFGDIIWQTDNFSEVRQAYLEDDEIETIYQRNLLE